MSARTRLLLGLAGVAATASAVQRDDVGRREVAVFRAVNGLPDLAQGPVWVVMQTGSFAAVPATACLALATGRTRLARQLLGEGCSAWVLAKALKHGVQRPRPAALLPETRCRGRDESGLGYVSGHAAVVAALAAAALPSLSPRGRLAALAAVPSVCLSRLYVGAHLPLDVLGGDALGVAVDAAAALGRRP